LADLTTIQTAIKAWVDSETTNVCIMAEGNGPKPDAPFFTYRLASFIDEAEDHTSSPDAISGDVVITGNRAFTVEINGYGPGVIQKLRDLKNSTRKGTILDTFRLSNLIIVNRLAITNLTGLDQSNFEERGMFELLMRTDSVITDTGSVIEDFNGTGTLSQPPKPDVTTTLEVTTP